MKRCSDSERHVPATLLGVAAALALGMPLWLSGCSPMTPTPTFAPTLLRISPDAASGPDYEATGAIAGAGEVDYYQLDLPQPYNSVVVMTHGDTDTEGQVETAQRAAVDRECEGERHKETPPCVWGYDADIMPGPGHTDVFNAMPPSRNFLWEGSLDAGTWYIRVTGADDATGDYRLTVELSNQDCPTYYCD